MIRSFKNHEAEALNAGEVVPAFHSFKTQAEKRLRILDAATSLNDLRALPSNRLEALKGDRAGQFSIRINDQWRICFSWQGSDAFDVEIVDYH